MAQFLVNFSDPKGFYYPGENVTGSITISLRDEIRFRELTLKFKGKSYCHWTSGTGDNKKSHTNQEEHFKHKIVLLTSLSTSDDMSLGPGEFSYPFIFQLPCNLPPTFESSRHTGYVQYSLKIAFNVNSGLKSDIKAKIPFKVIGTPIDLNQTPRLLEPADAVTEKFLCCLCCRSGPISLRCQINKQAFYIGEPIIFSVELDNKATDRELRKVEATLSKEVMMISSSSWKGRHNFPESSVLLTQSVQPGAEESWHNVRFNIPTNIVPTFENCKCIHVTYAFVVEVDIPNAIDTKVVLPITIANGVQTSQPVIQPPEVQPVPPAGANLYGMHTAPAGDLYQQTYPPSITMQPPPSQQPPSRPPPHHHGEISL